MEFIFKAYATWIYVNENVIIRYDPADLTAIRLYAYLRKRGVAIGNYEHKTKKEVALA